MKVIVRGRGFAQATWMNNEPDRESVQLLLSELSTFEAEWRGIALAFRLVIRACGRTWRQDRKKRGVKDGC